MELDQLLRQRLLDPLYLYQEKTRTQKIACTIGTLPDPGITTRPDLEIIRSEALASPNSCDAAAQQRVAVIGNEFAVPCPGPHDAAALARACTAPNSNFLCPIKDILGTFAPAHFSLAKFRLKGTFY
jgi:hypothetical protein